MTDSTTSYPEDFGNFYSFGARRIGRYLANHGMPVPDEQALHKALLDRFEEIDYLTAGRLLEKDDTSDWHTVVAGEVTSELSDFTVQAARTFPDALARVLGVCDFERIFPTAIDRLSDGIRLRVRDKTVAEIRRMRFEPCHPKQRQRVPHALKGIRAYGESERMVARLRSLPGFASIEFRLDPERDRELRGGQLYPFPANWATAMMAAMASLAVPVKRHVAQELVAQLFGAGSWQRLIAKEGEARVWSMPYAVTTSYSNAAAWRFYRTAGEGMLAFGQLLASWDGEALLIDRCGRAMLSDGFYASAAPVAKPEDADEDRWPVCTPVELINPSDSEGYDTLAEQVAATLAAGGDPMAMLGWQGDFTQRMLAANRRLGSIGERTMQLGDWWLRVFDAHNQAHLSLEQFRADGTRAKASSIALYKATLRHDPADGLLMVWADYDRKLVATIPDVSAEAIERLRRMIEEPADNPSAPPYWGGGDIRGEWPMFR